jgi:hypothetical protein
MKNKQILAIYDNGGTSLDRYTIYLNDSYMSSGSNINCCLTLSDNPTSPTGICQHSSGMLGTHNGKHISWYMLPQQHRDIIENYGYYVSRLSKREFMQSLERYDKISRTSGEKYRVYKLTQTHHPHFWQPFIYDTKKKCWNEYKSKYPTICEQY